MEAFPALLSNPKFWCSGSLATSLQVQTFHKGISNAVTGLREECKQGQLSCMCCVAIVPMSNMGPPCRKRGLPCPSAVQMCSWYERINQLWYGLNIFFCRLMATLSGRALHSLWSSLPQGAGLLLMLVQARWFCLTNTTKPPKVTGHLCSEELSQGCLFREIFFP